jgi:hypothetical protein
VVDQVLQKRTGGILGSYLTQVVEGGAGVLPPDCRETDHSWEVDMLGCLVTIGRAPQC